MRLAKRSGPGTAYAQLALIVIGSSLLVGCQSFGSSRPPEFAADGWQVIERVGDARYLGPDASGWAPALPAAVLPSGSRVATGAGGRVILARAGDHISAGPSSRFSMPSAGPGGSFEQRAGSLRYRIGERAEALTVQTPFLEIEVRGTIFDVTVSEIATEVAVERGQVRIATPDGLRQIELEAGQSAYAGGPTGAELAFRRGQGEPVEQVEPVVVPAMLPKAGGPEGRPPAAPPMNATLGEHRASTSGTAASEAAVPIAAMTDKRAAAAGGARPAPSGAHGRSALGLVVDPAAVPLASDAVPVGAAPAPGRPPSADNASGTGAERRRPPASPEARLFDRLTEGMVDSVPAARVIEEPRPHVRSL